jgi:hypothetical protein
MQTQEQNSAKKNDEVIKKMKNFEKFVKLITFVG